MLVVVGAQPGREHAAERLVERLGGRVGDRLAIVDGFTARVPAGAIRRLRRSAAIRSVARDVRLTLSSRREPARRRRRRRRAIDPPPAEIPTDVPADEAAHEVIEEAAEDAAAGSSLEPDPVASGEDTVPAVAGRGRPIPSRRSSPPPTTARPAPAPRST